jgi:hypothetical protein
MGKRHWSILLFIALVGSACSAGNSEDMAENRQRQELVGASSTATTRDIPPETTTPTTTTTRPTTTTTIDPVRKILLRRFRIGESGTFVQSLQRTVKAERTGAYDAQTRQLHIAALENKDLGTRNVPSLTEPTIALDCNKSDNPKIGEYAWVRPSFGATWNWDRQSEFDKIKMDYGDGKTYEADDSSTAAEKAFWHKYTAPGTYTVKATIFDTAGQQASDSCTWTWNCYDDRVTCKTAEEIARSYSDTTQRVCKALGLNCNGSSGSLGGSLGNGSLSNGWSGCYFEGQRIWGDVYITSSSWQADFDVYVTSSSWQADLDVYLADNSWQASSCGEWHLVDSSWQADFEIYLVDSSWQADFEIYLVDSSWQAGR